MSNPKSAPVGKTWTRILHRIHEASLITTEGVAEYLRPLKAGQFHPDPEVMRSVDLMLGAMKARGLIRRARPWSPGKLWAVDDHGREVLEMIAAAMAPKRFKTYAHHRRRSKRRRAKARALGSCVNENNRGTHGPATHGCRCESCYKTHRRSW